jgi:GntR family transcriptional regulator
MSNDWRDDLPIYVQLRSRVVDMILDGLLAEGEALPSVRVVAAEFRINPLTVLKTYQNLANEGVVESQRGRGMFVIPGAKALLLAAERRRFLAERWPRVVADAARLGISIDELLSAKGAQGAQAAHPTTTPATHATQPQPNAKE